MPVGKEEGRQWQALRTAASTKLLTGLDAHYGAVVKPLLAAPQTGRYGQARTIMSTAL
jgi:hypothetical protein